jgi:hypothetical protein
MNMVERSPAVAVPALALDVPSFAKACGMRPETIYRATTADIRKRGAIPFLPFIRVGRRLLIRVDTGEKWLSSLELRAS